MDKDKISKLFDNVTEDLNLIIDTLDEIVSEDEYDLKDNEGDNIISLTDEAGVETDFEFLDLIEYRDEGYVVLLPVEDSDEPGEVVILKLVSSEDDDAEEYVSVDDDQTLEAVFEIFKAKFADAFNFVD